MHTNGATNNVAYRHQVCNSKFIKNDKYYFIICNDISMYRKLEVFSCLKKIKIKNEWMASASSYHKLTIYSNYNHDNIAYILKAFYSHDTSVQNLWNIAFAINGSSDTSTIYQGLTELYLTAVKGQPNGSGYGTNPQSGDSSHPTHAVCISYHQPIDMAVNISIFSVFASAHSTHDCLQESQQTKC